MSRPCFSCNQGNYCAVGTSRFFKVHFWKWRKDEEGDRRVDGRRSPVSRLVEPKLQNETNGYRGACRRPEPKFCRRQNLDQSGLAARIPARGIQALSTVTPDDDRQREQTTFSKINGPSGPSAAPGEKRRKRQDEQSTWCRPIPWNEAKPTRDG